VAFPTYTNIHHQRLPAVSPASKISYFARSIKEKNGVSFGNEYGILARGREYFKDILKPSLRIPSDTQDVYFIWQKYHHYNGNLPSC